MKYDVEIMLDTNGKKVPFYGMIPSNFEEIEKDRRHPAVIILAGGAYWRRTPREKEPVALKFMAEGISAWILEYSVAPDIFPQALCEVLTAVRWLREHAQEYYIDPDKISVCGFSAGGHLAASTGCFWNRDFIQERLGKPGELVRPNKLILCYPVITVGKYAHQESIQCLLGERLQDEKMRALVSLETQVGADFPATFLWHTFEDAGVPVQNALLLGEAIARQEVLLEMHIYPEGRHGLSTGDFTSCSELKDGQKYECADWMEKAVRFMQKY